MNKGITILVLLVLFSAMGLVFYSHLRSASEDFERPRNIIQLNSSNVSRKSNYSKNSASFFAQGEAFQAPVVLTNGNLTERSLPFVAPGKEALLGTIKANNTATILPTESSPSHPGLPSLHPLKTSPGSKNAKKQQTTPKETIKKPLANTKKPEKKVTVKKAEEQKKAEGQKKTEEQKPQKQKKASDLKEKSQAQNKTEDATEKDGNKHLKSVALQFAGQQMKLHVESEQSFTFKVFELANPPRLVVDLLGSWQGVTTPRVPNNRVVKNVRVSNQKERTRFVLDLQQKARKYRSTKVNNNVLEVFVE